MGRPTTQGPMAREGGCLAPCARATLRARRAARHRLSYNARVTEGAKKLLSQAMRLPLDERAELAADLLASIDGEPDKDADAAWAAEIERRAARALAGKSEGRPWRDALDHLGPERGK